VKNPRPNWNSASLPFLVHHVDTARKEKHINHRTETSSISDNVTNLKILIQKLFKDVLGQRFFRPKDIFAQKYLFSKNDFFGQKLFFRQQKYFFGYKIFVGQKMFFFSQKMLFQPKNIFAQKMTFRAKIIVSPKNVLFR